MLQARHLDVAVNQVIHVAVNHKVLLSTTLVLSHPMFLPRPKLREIPKGETRPIGTGTDPTKVSKEYNRRRGKRAEDLREHSFHTARLPRPGVQLRDERLAVSHFSAVPSPASQLWRPLFGRILMGAS